MPIVNRLADLHPEITAWRRDIHAHPELLYDVHRTAALVADKLKNFGCDEVVTGLGRTGVVGVIRGAGAATASSGNARVIALRADMDALPSKRPTTCRTNRQCRAGCTPAATTATPRCCSVQPAIFRRRAISPVLRS